MDTKVLFKKHYWLKTFLISVVICFILLLVLFIYADAFTSNAGEALVVSFISSIVFGLIYTYFRYSKKIKNNSEQKKAREKLAQEDEFKNEVGNYDNLKVSKTKRGQAAFLMIGLMVFSILLSVFNVVSRDNLYGLIIYVPLTYFVYKGHRWAIIGAMAMWTIDKSFQVYSLNGKSFMPIFFWWLILITPLYQAFQVETERRKEGKNKNSQANFQPTLSPQNNDIPKQFCSSCGKEINYEGKFCRFCGNQLT